MTGASGTPPSSRSPHATVVGGVPVRPIGVAEGPMTGHLDFASALGSIPA